MLLPLAVIVPQKIPAVSGIYSGAGEEVRDKGYL
jgi:hypothetical protein